MDASAQELDTFNNDVRLRALGLSLGGSALDQGVSGKAGGHHHAGHRKRGGNRPGYRVRDRR